MVEKTKFIDRQSQSNDFLSKIKERFVQNFYFRKNCYYCSEINKKKKERKSDRSTSMTKHVVGLEVPGAIPCSTQFWEHIICWKKSSWRCEKSGDKGSYISVTDFVLVKLTDLGCVY